MKKIFFVILFLTIPTLYLLACPSHDILYYNGDTLVLHDCPLTSLLEQSKSDSALSKLKHSRSCFHCSHWKIENDSLFLLDIFNCDHDSEETLLKMFDKKYVKNGCVFSYWYTGEINIDYGKLVGHSIYTMGWNIFEKELIINIRKGKVAGSNIYDTYINADDRLERLTPEGFADTIKKYVQLNFNWDAFSQSKEISKLLIVSVNEHGIIDKIYQVIGNQSQYFMAPISQKKREKNEKMHKIITGSEVQIGYPEVCKDKYCLEIFNSVKNLKWDIIQVKNIAEKYTYAINIKLDFKNNKIY